MLKFYFQFRFSRLHYQWHVIVHLPTKFRPNRTMYGNVTTS